jgi:phosphoribosylamine--glycine ligase
VKALVIGGGGSEHALAWKLGRSPAVGVVFTAPGNYGTNLVGANVQIPVTDPEALADWALEMPIDLVVVGSETALRYGAVDVLRRRGLRVFGPTRAASQLQTSKSWAKAFMARHEIPTAPGQAFDHLEQAEQFLRGLPDDRFPVVVKPDGLVASAMVTVAQDRHVAIGAARLIAEASPRSAGPLLLVEDCLSGYELWFTALCDGSTVLPLPTVHSYKRSFDGNTGAITKAMGAYAPESSVTPELTELILARIMRRVVAGMAMEETPFQGLLQANLMIGREGPRVMGFNVCWGDPETQVLLPRLTSDLYLLLDAAIDGQLAEASPPTWLEDATCGVVVASEGYPGEVETGYGIVGLREAGAHGWVFHNGTRNPYSKPDALVTPRIARLPRGAFGGRSFFGMFVPTRGAGQVADRHAAQLTRSRESQVVTSGGRVLTVVGRGRTLAEARASAYRLCGTVEFTGSWHRGDIGANDQGHGQ